MKSLSFKVFAAIIIALPVFFSACIKDTCRSYHTYTYYEPVYKTKDEVRANIKSNGSRPIENPGKLNILGNYIFLNEIDKGIHIIDNTDPSKPKNFAFIDIPGNLDIAVKGNTLYADLYTDLIAIDITNPANVKVSKIIDNIFPERYFGGRLVSNSDNILIADWVRKDTTVEETCNDNDSWRAFLDNGVFFAQASLGTGSGSASPVGVGGSMARFTILDKRLYTVNSKDLDVFNISNTADPQHSNRINVGWSIETIYPFKSKLFIGSQTGMYIYNVSNPDAPSSAGQFNHTRSCDPVIADDNYAYVTLRSGTPCQGFINELEIVKLNNFANPSLVKVYPMKNPHGLSKDGDLLFICDGSEGLKIYNATNVMNLQHIKTIGGLEAYDVIAFNKRALMVAKDGLYQYNYSDPSNITLLSKMSIHKN